MVVCKLPILLAERKMRVADLIRGTGINKTTLHKLYNGELTRIDLDTIDRICDHLNIEVGDLFVLKKTIKIMILKTSLVTNGHKKRAVVTNLSTRKNFIISGKGVGVFL